MEEPSQGRKRACGLQGRHLRKRREPDQRVQGHPQPIGAHVADVAKVITIIGSSPESFAKAADAAVQEAAKTLRGITGADVVSMSALVENERISEYRTTVNIAFAVERAGSGGG